MKRLLFTAALIVLVPAAGFSAEVSGHVTPGAQIVDVDPNSSKFNEYRDIDDGFYLYSLGLETETGNGYFLDLKGKNVGRDDQNILLRGGRYGRWGVALEWDEIPHRLSNKAQTPFIRHGDGLFTVPTTVPLVSNGSGAAGDGKNLDPAATTQTAADGTGGNDAVTEAWLRANLHPVDLGNDREKGTASFSYSLLENLKFRLTVSNEDREGNKITYGPIGDRPPRSLNIQFTEPIDYRTQEVKFETDYTGEKVQANFTYLLSKFENEIDTLTWQNIYTDPAGDDAAGTYEFWNDTVGNLFPRNVATFGRRALPQDNLYQNASLSVGVELPLHSRLTATGSYGLAEQDEDLIPYSTNGTVDATAAGDGLAWNDPAKLPRSSADAEVETMLFNLDYIVKPVQRLELRAFYRYFDLNNNTPVEEWRYPTNDVMAANGSVTYLNKRRNLDEDYDKQNYGLEGNYAFSLWASALGLGFEREEFDRKFREADTDENIYRVSLRSRPAKGVSFRTKYQYGDREVDGEYDPEAAHETYWYAASEANNNIDSGFTFENHPDTRRFDVTDRERNLFEFLISVNALEALDLSANYRYRKDDYDSDVKPSQPLAHYAGSRAAETGATSPGDQVGLLEDERQQYGLDISYAPTERLTLTAFASREDAETQQRGFEYDENNKANPSGIAATAELGPWTRQSMQWKADVKDRTNTFGVGAGFVIIPGKLRFAADYTYSAGKIDIEYSGFGAQSSVNPATTLADNYQFAFRSPPTVRNDRYTLNANLEYQVIKNLSLGLGYLYERFKIRDWQQEANTPWFEAVAGNEFLLRDTSRSSQWGNRLPNLGSYLAPSYEAHVGMLSMTYKF